MGGRGGGNPIVIQIPNPEYKFEYDENKSRANKEKHGIDFKEAQALWKDDQGLKARSPYANEERGILTAKYNDKYYSMIYTLREDRIRIISVRRARDKEVKSYEQED
jgi:uncharacterized DUF497 family protein